VAAVVGALRALPPLLREPPGFGVHVVHVSDAGALRLLREARAEGLPLTAETCPHYLTFAAEDVPDGDTRFKCAPPLRGAANRDALWAALEGGQIDGLSSDHSPSTPELKQPASGDFAAAWGGIAGLQYSLPATWDGMRARGLSPSALHRAWSAFPAGLAGLARRKGALAAGMDADIVVWAPEGDADTSLPAAQHRHDATSPYVGAALKGRVLATFVRGSQVFDAARGVAPAACGRGGLRRGAPPAARAKRAVT
jgi:allantoinase